MRRTRWVAALGAGLLLASACSSDEGEQAGRTGDPSTTSTTAAVVRTPQVEPATLEGPITVGEFNGPADPRPVELDVIDYVQEEYFASGTATSYTVDERTEDGEWDATPADSAPYKTRFVVRRPRDPAAFSGTVVVEWLNVTVVEAGPEWAYGSPAIVDSGAAWVGVSVQALSIMGGQSALQSGDARQAESAGGLRNNNPERYGSLTHPGDAFAFDIYSQIGAAMLEPGDAPLFGDATAERVLAAGESQSAGFLAGYINGVHPLATAYDGFFVHSRGASAAALDGTRSVRGGNEAFLLRTDLDVPVLQFETETDVGPLLAFGRARQDDHDLLRTWEVPGTAHADAFLVGGQFSACPYPVNDGPQHWVLTAALAAMLEWIEEGTAPAGGERIETTGDGTVITRDERGLALGGIRTPSVEAPVSVLSGEGEEGAPVLCALFGKSTPFDAATLQELYGDRDGYLEAFDEALDAAIEEGFVRDEDREGYAAEARAVEFPA